MRGVNQLRSMLKPKPTAPFPQREQGAISTGCTLLNLACTDTPNKGFLPGRYYYLVGDSMSAKTWLSWTCLAEASINPKFDRYRLIFDDVEGGSLMDIRHYFGAKVADRLEKPNKNGNSDTVEDFYFNVSDALSRKEPFIYVLDSQDALDSKAARSKFQARKKAHLNGKEEAGSYGDGKAKYHSEHLRQVVSQLRKNGSILIIIGQTRDNLGFSFEPKTRSGGKSLRFYATIEIWTSVAGKIQKTVRDKPRTVGVKCLAEVKKNRVSGKTGKDRSVQIPIYYGHGIDDIGSCVDFLIAEKHWTKSQAGFDAGEMLIQGSREKIIRHIEKEGLEPKLRKIVAELWTQIDQECLVRRKKRYL